LYFHGNGSEQRLVRFSLLQVSLAFVDISGSKDYVCSYESIFSVNEKREYIRRLFRLHQRQRRLRELPDFLSVMVSSNFSDIFVVLVLLQTPRGAARFFRGCTTR